MPIDPFFVAPGEGRGGVKAGAEDTAGALGLVETVIPAGHSTPLHVHADEDEAFYLPRGIPHTFLGISEEPSRVLVLLLPGGLEEAFAEPARFQELLEQHHVEIVGPPLSRP